MQPTINQFEAEEKTIKENLLKAGFDAIAIENSLVAIKDSSADNKQNRNIAIKEVADVLRGQTCALQAWYVQNILSRISGLSPNYIQIIINSVNPQNILKNGTKN